MYGENPMYAKSIDKVLEGGKVLERAYSKLGSGLYDLQTNNDEHFASWCKCGVSCS